MLPKTETKDQGRPKVLKLILSLILPITIGILIYKFGINFSTTGIQKTSDITLSISGMIFTIMGVWIAFIYPNAILRLKSNKLEPADFTENQEEKERLGRIVGAIVQSSLVAIAILVANLASAVIENPHQQTETPAIAAIIISAAILQVEGIIQVIRSNIDFLSDLHSKSSRKKTEQQL